MVSMLYLFPTLGLFIMNTSQHRKQWKVLCWNVRGLDAEAKWDSIRDKIVESKCDVVCLQETKKGTF